MTAANLIILQTRNSVDALFDNAYAIPEDRLTWEPMAGGRTVLSQLQECAQVPAFLAHILDTQEALVYDRAKNVEMLRQRREWTTIGECERICRFNTDRLIQSIENFPEDQWEARIQFPFDQNPLMFVQVASRHFQNNTYHIGQICYIQTLLGDKEIHKL